jgi:hypothetical protein
VAEVTRVQAVVGCAILFLFPLAIGGNSICAQANAQQQMVIGLEQFDAWIFQGGNNREQSTREMLDGRVDQELRRIEQVVELDETQTARLKLAGRGDVKRFFDRVETARRKFLEIQPKLERNNVNDAYQLALPLQQELAAGLFGSKSLLQKTISSTLDDQQLEVLQREIERTDRLRAERAIKLTIAQMQRQVPMTADQRSKLSDLLIAKVGGMKTNDQYAQYLIQFRMSEIPRETFTDIFDGEQMKAIDRSIQQGRAMAAMLRQRGMLNE